MIIKADARHIPLKDKSVDAIITDPPYGLSFMGKEWDHGVPGVEFWIEALRVAKPGAYLLAFGGSRTYHRLACAIEDAGWEIRDCIMWLYGSGFPKSLDVSKAIDKELGVAGERVITHYKHQGPKSMFDGGKPRPASLWQGWGTALKPAFEPIIMARKPIEGTVARNVQKWGTGAINIDISRIEHCGNIATEKIERSPKTNGILGKFADKKGQVTWSPDQGRWPANIIHDGSDEVLAGFPDSAGQLAPSGPGNGERPSINVYGDYGPRPQTNPRGDFGSSSRFFYTAKASPGERGKGNNHPTVKPIALMEYLIKMVTRPGAIILDQFCGSGSTVIASQNTGRVCIGIDKDYQGIQAQRIGGSLFAKVVNSAFDVTDSQRSATVAR